MAYLHIARDISNEKHGATREEIAEALAVAINLNTGAALTCTARALDVHDHLQTNRPAGGLLWAV